MTSPWMRVEVDVHDHHALGPAEDAGALDGHVDLLVAGLDGELGPQRLGVGAGDGHLDARHRVGRQAFDAVDVGPARGDAAGDPGHRGGGERVAEHRDVQAPSPAGLLGGRSGGQFEVHVQVGGDLLDGGPQAADGLTGALRFASRVGHQDAERQAATDDHLLDVGDGHGETGEYGEQSGG